MIRSTLALAAALALAALPLPAQDGQLYEDPADPDASFVRIVAPGETLAVVAGTTFDDVRGGVTPYVIVAAGAVTVAVGDVAGAGEIPPTSFHSFVRGRDGLLHMVRDEITNSPAQADLVFYNLSDLPLVDLYVPAASAMAITGIAPDTSRQVTLKAPLTLDFEVREGDVVRAELAGIQMRRRAGVTVVFSGKDGAYAAHATENLYSK